MENHYIKIINPKTLISTPSEFYLTGQGVFLKIRFRLGDIPVIIDKRSGCDVEQLRLHADREKIAIIEDAALTRSLFELTELGDEILPETYAPIVKICAFLYRRVNSEYLAGPTE